MAPPTNFDTTRIRFGEMVAGVSGLVLIISPFLEWFNISVKNSVIHIPRWRGSGWDALSWIPWFITITGFVAVAFAVMRAMGVTPPNLPASPGLHRPRPGRHLDDLRPASGSSSPQRGGCRRSGRRRPFVRPLRRVPGRGRRDGRRLADVEPRGQAAPAQHGRWRRRGAGGCSAPGRAAVRGRSASGAGTAPAGRVHPACGGRAAGGAARGAAQPAAAAAKADWYPDPRGEKRLRYWDGSQWTDHTAD